MGRTGLGTNAKTISLVRQPNAQNRRRCVRRVKLGKPELSRSAPSCYTSVVYGALCIYKCTNTHKPTRKTRTRTPLSPPARNPPTKAVGDGSFWEFVRFPTACSSLLRGCYPKKGFSGVAKFAASKISRTCGGYWQIIQFLYNSYPLESAFMGWRVRCSDSASPNSQVWRGLRPHDPLVRSGESKQLEVLGAYLMVWGRRMIGRFFKQIRPAQIVSPNPPGGPGNSNFAGAALWPCGRAPWVIVGRAAFQAP